MPVNTAAANFLADQLSRYDTQLAQAKTSLREYQSIISANWQGEEALLIGSAIDKVLAEINAAANQLNPLSSDIRGAAEQIRREEEAADKARKQAMINQIRADIDRKQAEASTLRQKIAALNKTLASRPKTLAGLVLAAKDKLDIALAQKSLDDVLRQIDELQKQFVQLSK